MTPSLLSAPRRDRPSRLVVEIDSLAMRGFAPVEQAQLSAAIADALLRAPRNLASAARVQRRHSLNSTARGREIGAAVAAALPRGTR